MDRSFDELMWLLAEENDDAAIEAFIKRYPAHRAEVIRRVNMVRGLKGNRPVKEASAPIPAFQVKEGVPDISTNSHRGRWIWGVAVAVPLLAVAGYFQFRTPNQPNVPVVTTNTPTATAETPNIRDNPGYDPYANVVPKTPNDTPRQIAYYDKVVSLSGSNQSLLLLFSEITRQTGLHIEIGPGFQDRPVDFAASGLTAISALKQLGKQGNFTVFEQDPQSVLIIPAVDPNAQPATPMPAFDVEASPSELPPPDTSEGTLPKISSESE